MRCGGMGKQASKQRGRTDEETRGSGLVFVVELKVSGERSRTRQIVVTTAYGG